MKKQKDTFSLTALQENAYKNSKKEVAVTRSQKRMASQSLVPRKSLIPKTKIIYGLMGSIKDSSLHQIKELEDESSLKKAISTLESSETVQVALEVLKRHLVKKKHYFNKIHAKKNLLLKQVSGYSQKIADLNADDKNILSNWNTYELLQQSSEQIMNKIHFEKQYSENLKHMLDSRKTLLNNISSPSQILNSQMKEINTKMIHLNKITQSQERSIQTQRAELQKTQDEVNSQKEHIRAHLNRDLKNYQNRCKAVAFYKQSQKQWMNHRITLVKSENVRALQKLEKKFLQQEKLKKEFSEIQIQLAEREDFINKILKATSTSSLEELGDRLRKLKESKCSLLKSHNELEDNLNKQAERTQKLNFKLDHITVDTQVKTSTEYKGTYQMEMKISEKEKEVEYLNLKLEDAKKNSSAVLLSLFRLVQKLSDDKDSEYKSINGIREAVEFLKQKVQQISN